MFPTLNWFQIVPSFVIAFLISFGLHSIDVMRIDAKHVKEIADLTTKLNKECADDKAITTEVSHEYQNKLADLNAKLVAAKRVRSSCVPVASATTGHDATTIDGKSVGSHGVNTEWLYDYAAEAERYRLQLTACQSFIAKTWAVKTQ